MIDVKTRQGPRAARVLGYGGIALLLLTTGCKISSNAAPTNPTISASASRSSAGVLQGLSVRGKGFTANGPVHVTVLMAASGTADNSPYVEEDVKADASGKLVYDRKPLACPQPADYGTGSWVTVSARDTTTGIAGEALIHPGKSPDCGS